MLRLVKVVDIPERSLPFPTRVMSVLASPKAASLQLKIARLFVPLILDPRFHGLIFTC